MFDGDNSYEALDIVVLSSFENRNVNPTNDVDEPWEDVLAPFIGQCFMSEEEAFTFYQMYAQQLGFSVRKGRFVNKNGECKRRDFFCHREGSPPSKVFDSSRNQRDRSSIRCECKASMRITLRKAFDIFPNEWHVTQFTVEHNHDLLSSSEMRFLPINRNITDADKDRILLLKDAGLSVRQIIRVMELEKKVKHGHLPFLERDVRNLYSNVKRNNAKNDAMEILEYCRSSKEKNSKFQYAYTLDDEKRLEHIFWCPPSCFDWYQAYGDVVVFDTTYRVNAYDMPFGIFVGVNNHGKTILFGCALIRNETTSTFQWLMKTFSHLMKKAPKTILTDQDPWLTFAISKEFPETKHSFCIWHITAKFSGWFTAILRSQYNTWCDDFYKLYRMDTIEEFEQGWPEVVSKHKLDNNKHIIGLYKIRHFWVPAYLRNYFFGGMTTTGRSESINVFIKRFIDSHTSLCRFVEQIELAVDTIEEVEAHDKMLQTFRNAPVKTISPLEKDARIILTPFAFKKFQEENGKACQYKVSLDLGNEYVMQHYQSPNGKSHKVFWDGKIAKCSCKNFEFSGMLCRHIMRVFSYKDCFEIPKMYFHPHWHREYLNYGEISDVIVTSYETVLPMAVEEENIIKCPPQSKCKGRPKQKRLKGGRELAKQERRCTLCKLTGHNISTCPQKKNIMDTAPHEKENVEPSTNIHMEKKLKKTSPQDLGLNPIFCLKY